MPARDSRFVYPRSIQNDVADALATARSRVGVDDLWVIDLVTKVLIDTFYEFDPAFSEHADAWARRAKYLVGRPRTNDTGDQRHG